MRRKRLRRPLVSERLHFCAAKGCWDCEVEQARIAMDFPKLTPLQLQAVHARRYFEQRDLRPGARDGGNE